MVSGDAAAANRYADELAEGGGDPWWDYVAGHQMLLAGGSQMLGSGLTLQWPRPPWLAASEIEGLRLRWAGDEAGFGDEAVQQAGAVLHLLQAGPGQGGELIGGVRGEVAQAALEAGPDPFSRFAAVQGSLDKQV